MKNYAKTGIKIKVQPAALKLIPQKDKSKETVVCDLHVGENTWENRIRRPAPNKLKIQPNTCRVIETAEVFTVPDNVFGVICSRASIASRGLYVANAKVDPLYVQPLKLVVFNTTKQTIILKKGEAFCSVFFAKLCGRAEGARARQTPL
ncbi:MAG: hypothetical protein HY922_11015 [Elusimicrobia bacterium]|nr:hypothetical protein [Elusimicrobiota bacterium]